MKYREPYRRLNRNRFGEAYIIIACACGAGSSADGDYVEQPPYDPPHKADCPIRLRSERRSSRAAS